MASLLDEKQFEALLDEIDSKESKETPLFDMIPSEFAEFIVTTYQPKLNQKYCDSDTWNKLRKLLVKQQMTAWKLSNKDSKTWPKEWQKECGFKSFWQVSVTIPFLFFVKKEIDKLKERLQESDINFFQNELKKYRIIPVWLLEVCAKEGYFKMAEFLCDIGVKSNDFLIDLARNNGNHAVCSLLLFRKTGASLGEKVSKTINEIDAMNGISQYAIKNMSQQHMEQNIDFMITSIETQSPICEQLLNITMTYLHDIKYKNDTSQILHCKLFKTIIEQFEKIIMDTTNKIGFAWLNMFIIPSNIWFWDHPIQKQKLLYYELLIRIEKESKIQAIKWLKNDIEQLKKQNNGKLWSDLVAFGDENINNNIINVRQDALRNGLKSPYSIFDLISKKQVGGWNPVEHYNCNIFLNQLLMNANDIDDIFQNEIYNITNIITKSDDILMKNSSFHRGPIKRAERSRVKVQSDYFNESFPSSSKLLDINRCSLYFTNAQSMYLFLIKFTDYINSKKSNIITDIARIKNGFKDLDGKKDENDRKDDDDDDDEYVQYFYADIKLNVVIKNELIGEIQLLLKFMSDFKNSVSHSLYSIQRHEEFVDNFSKIKEELLDETTQLMTNASFGNYKLILNHIVSHNEDIEEYLFQKAGNDLNMFTVAILSDQSELIEKLWKYIIPKLEIKERYIDSTLIRSAIKKRCSKSLILIFSEWPQMIYCNPTIIPNLVCAQKCHIVFETIFKKMEKTEKIKILLFMDNQIRHPSFYFGLKYESMQQIIMNVFKNEESKTILNAFNIFDKHNQNGFMKIYSIYTGGNTLNILKWLQNKLSKSDMFTLYGSISGDILVDICQHGTDQDIEKLKYFTIYYLETNDVLTNNEKLKYFLMNDESASSSLSPLMSAMQHKHKKCIEIIMEYCLKNHPKSKTDIVFKMKKFKDYLGNNVFNKDEYGGDEMQAYLQSFIDQFVVAPKKKWVID